MSTFDLFVLPAGMLLASAVGGFFADRTAWIRRRASGGDRGDFWTRIVLRVCLLLALPVLLSGALASLPELWRSGWHLQFDLTGFGSWPVVACYRVALLFPFAVWGGLLLFGLAEKPGDRDVGRWLAGAIGDGRSRLWVLLGCVPLLAILVLAAPDLGGGPGAYPAAAWGTIAILLFSLIGVAWSAGNDPIATRARKSEPAAVPVQPLTPWPDALRARGIAVRHLVTWAATANTRSVRGASRRLAEMLAQRGTSGVAPELIEAVDELLATDAGEENRSRVVFAADDCGQTEIVALAAEILHQRFHAETLVITAGDPQLVAAQLAHHLPERRVIAVGSPADVEANAVVIVADAQMISDGLLPKFKAPGLVKRFGLIVWWHLEAYTGVLAANLWAISRRLHRLLQAMGRPDVRTLIFMRSMAYGGAQQGAFVRRLLPQSLPVHAEVHVEPRFPRELHLHLIESHRQLFERGEGRNIQDRIRHAPLIAAKVSVEERWPTYLEAPLDVPFAESEAFLDLAVAGTPLRDVLEAEAAGARAEIRSLTEADVLSVIEIVGQGGRASDEGQPHHVGITPPANPYAAHLLSTLASNGGTFSASRRLVSATAHPGVMRRHLLLALDELSDTWSGLLRTFLWDEALIGATLEQLAQEGKLSRSEVRFLDDQGELRREHEYKINRPPSGERRPLDTVGTTLIDVRDRAAGNEAGEGVRMRVDPERLTIQAYPHRVFVRNGQRYRIRRWDSTEEVLSAKLLECDREGVCSRTWRMRHVLAFGIEPSGPPVGIGRTGNLLARFPATLHYEEHVVGTLRLVPDLTTGVAPKPETMRLARTIVQSFVTRALVLRFPREQTEIALSSLAQALRDVLPVHLGVEEDALEVVPLVNTLVQGRPISGLAIVDLYPRGIGVVEAIADDNSFLLQLLDSTRKWLAACPCQSEQGCEGCLRSAASEAANRDFPPLRGAALSLLEQVV